MTARPNTESAAMRYRPFQRSLSNDATQRLMASALFEKRLLPDIMQDPAIAGAARRRVFPAIRHEQVDFYHRGGRLFSFDSRGFKTHLKYAAVFADGQATSQELREEDLGRIKPIHDFASGYEAMKSLCALYSGVEANGVAAIYQRFSSVLASVDRPIVILDIEASLDASAIHDGDTESQQDRIDMVLLDTASRLLLGVEAKHFSNPELRAASGPPPVAGQVERYRQQLAIQKEHVLCAYGQQVRALNRLFGLSLPEPEAIVMDVPVLIFGFDAAQREATVNFCRDNLESYSTCCVAIGDPAQTKTGTMQGWFERAMQRHRGV